jgi:hypothetical protein
VSDIEWLQGERNTRFSSFGTAPFELGRPVMAPASGELVRRTGRRKTFDN